MTGDKKQGTMGKRKMRGEAHFILPTLFCTLIFIERETSGYQAGLRDLHKDC